MRQIVNKVLIVTLSYDYEGADIIDVFDADIADVRAWVETEYKNSNGYWLNEDCYRISSGGNVEISVYEPRKI